MQAIGFLSRREHSRQELRRKLLDALRRRAREDAALQAAAEELARAVLEQPSNGIDDAFTPRAAAAAPAVAVRALAHAEHPDNADHADHADHDHADHDHDPANDAHSEPDGADPEAEVDRLLDWLVANKYLSDARFVESRVSARSRKQGTLRIRMELSRHGLALEPEQAATLRETEFARARDLWQRRFGEVSGDPRQRAKQARFLAARGFAADVVRRIVGGLDEE